MQASDGIGSAIAGRTVMEKQRISEACGVALTTLYQYAEGLRTPPITLIPTLCAATGNRAPLDALIRATDDAMSRGKQMPLPLPVSDLDLVREAQDIPGALLRGLTDDGRLDAREVRRVSSEVNEFIAALFTWLSQRVRRAARVRCATLADAERMRAVK